MFDYNYEKRDNVIADMSEAEVRACMFEEACYYRTYGLGEEKTSRIDRNEAKTTHREIEEWRHGDKDTKDCKDAK